MSSNTPGIPMILTCPTCGARHIDQGEWATKPHHTHACQSCGLVWRPATVNTVGVQFLPGFKNDPSATQQPSKVVKETRPRCHGGRDGDCYWEHCPQNLPGNRKGHCPLDLLYPGEGSNDPDAR